MEQTEYQVGIFIILHILNPLFGASGHLFELQTFPDGLVEPVGDSWGKHADYYYLYAILIVNRVGLKSCVDVLRACCSILILLLYDVGTKQWASNLTNPLVVYFMTRFNVVIAHSFGIILHIIDDRSCYILIFRHHIVRPVYTWLTLQNVAIVNQQEVVVAVLLALLFDIAVGTCKSAPDGLLLHEIIWEEMTMHIASLYDLDLYGLRVLCLYSCC